ncbi:MAG: aldehyde dehydrogenase family protein [Planctomycetota bacterium]
MSEVDAVVRRVARSAATWRALDREARVAMLQTIQQDLIAAAPGMVADALAAKGIDPQSQPAGEEWLTGPGIVLRYLRLLRDHLLRGGFPQSRIETREVLEEEGGGEAWVARVFPYEAWDGLLFPGLKAEVWGEPGSAPSCASLFAADEHRTAAVLGAGNINSIPPLDFLDQLFRHGRVVVVKLNPINEYLRPHLEQAFRVLIAGGFLGFVSGHHEVGAELVKHPEIEAVHLTGSEVGFRAVAAQAPAKHYSAELGAVTPVLVVPGPWTRRDIRVQAQQLAGTMAINNGYNCLTPKLVVTAGGWRQREAFLAELDAAMRALPPRPAWYPGAVERWTRFVHHYGGSVDPHEPEHLPFVLLRDVPSDAEELALREEAFCGVLAETALDVTDPEDFLEQAVDLVNEKVYGTLSANLIASPTTPRAALDRAVARLRYGTVGMNIWAGMGFVLGSTTWGAFPGHAVEEPGSGIDVVHNAFLFDHPQKSVLKSPFRPSRKALWMPGHRGLRALGKGLVDYEGGPSLRRLLRLVPAAYLG